MFFDVFVVLVKKKKKKMKIVDGLIVKFCFYFFIF